ncbi:hypothetical protein D9757_006873 [Collybiopsis confluens]|uniref:Uncharacterized protein n=1 Tax=Collybiopsis confluens TaxID=2823264 RepID=A0A8H5HPM5_9AGAR|nr:hypothetical protein D9757_006873 [Collybiopsis confluens]
MSHPRSGSSDSNMGTDSIYVQYCSTVQLRTFLHLTNYLLLSPPKVTTPGLVLTVQAYLCDSSKPNCSELPVVATGLLGRLHLSLPSDEVRATRFQYCTSAPILPSDPYEIRPRRDLREFKFTGDSVATLGTLGVEERLTIANEALAGVFVVAKKLLGWYDSVLAKLELRTFAQSGIPPPPELPHLNCHPNRPQGHTRPPPPSDTLHSDPGAQHAQRLVFNLSSLVPHVSGPSSPKRRTSPTWDEDPC